MRAGFFLRRDLISGAHRFRVFRQLNKLMLLLTMIIILSESTEAQTRRDLEAELHRLRIQESAKHPQWSKFGSIMVDWNSWRLHANGTRTVNILKNVNTEEENKITPIWRAQITPSTQLKSGRLAVDCKNLKTSQTKASGEWDGWSLPQASSKEEEIVLKICTKITDN